MSARSKNASRVPADTVFRIVKIRPCASPSCREVFFYLCRCICIERPVVHNIRLTRKKRRLVFHRGNLYGQWIEAVFVMILGCLCHFLYAWSSKRHWVGLVTVVNESTWKHLKLLFFPMSLCTVLQGLFCSVLPGYWPCQARRLCVELLSIVFGVASRLQYAQFVCLHVAAGPWLWALLFIAFLSFACHPPHIALFKDPLFHIYGFPRRR